MRGKNRNGKSRRKEHVALPCILCSGFMDNTNTIYYVSLMFDGLCVWFARDPAHRTEFGL
jgi:hypothetical protein